MHSENSKEAKQMDLGREAEQKELREEAAEGGGEENI